MSVEFCKYLRKRPSCYEMMSLAEFSREAIKDGIKAEIVCDMYAIIHWLCPTFDYETLNELCLETRLIDFVKSLRYVGINPVFFIVCAVGCHLEQFDLLLPSLKQQYIDKLSIHFDSTRYNYDNISVNPLLIIQLYHVLLELSVNVVHCTDISNVELFHYISQRQVCGVLSNNVDFALVPNCRFFDIVSFDLDNCLKFVDTINSQPEDIKCSYTSLNLIVNELHLTDEQIIDAVMLHGNIYTQYLKSAYKLENYLELKNGTFEQCLQYVIKHNCPIFEEEEKLTHLSEVIPLFRHTVDVSYRMYFTPEQSESTNAVANWIRKSSNISSVIYAIANSGIYWRDVLFESVTVGRVSIHDLLVPVRELLYELLGVEKVTEYGSTSVKSFAETIVNVTVVENDILQRLYDIQLLTLKEKVSLLFKYIIYRRLIIDAKLLSSTVLECVKEENLMKYSILSLSLYLYGTLIAPNELEGLVEFILTHITKCNTSEVYMSANKPDEKSLTVSVWYAHVLQIIYYFCEVLGLTQHLPKPMELFLTFSAAKFISCNLSSFVPDYSKSPVSSKSIMSLPSVKLFCSSCRSTVSDGNCLLLVQLFSDAVEDVMKYATSELIIQSQPALDISSELQSCLTIEQDEKEEINGSLVEEEDDSTTYSMSVLYHKDTILNVMESHRVICIVGEAGCGKSSMIPQFILDDAPDNQCNIVVTQPRCVGAITLASRVSDQLYERCGQTVGYAVGSRKCVTRETRLLYCTSGYLLQNLIHHPFQVRRYTHIILDEVHERSIDMDFILFLVRKLVNELSPQTKIILMSATMQCHLLISYFREVFEHSAVSEPVFVGKKCYHVDEYYLDELSYLLDKYREEDCTNKEQIFAKRCLELLHSEKKLNKHFETFTGTLKASVSFFAQEICTELIVYLARPGESILVFLPGLTEILDYFDMLLNNLEKRNLKSNFDLFVLHSQVSLEEQQSIFEPPSLQTTRVVLSTTIAESALTIPSLTIVINFGISRMPKYDYKQKMVKLVTTWCSKAACSQRSGRVGRLCNGISIHLFPKSFYHHILPDFNLPEMHVTPLGKLLLRARQIGEELGIGKPSELLKLVIEPPSLLQIEYALQELSAIGATVCDGTLNVTETADITWLGKFSLSLPFDLELCRLIFFGLCFGCPVEGIIMATSLSLQQDIFSMPSRFVIKSQEDYRVALSENIVSRFSFDSCVWSDLIMYCRVFKDWFEFSKERSMRFAKSLSKFCISNSLNYNRFHTFICIVSSVANSILSFIETNSNCYKQLYALSLVTKSDLSESLTFCDDIHKLQALIFASFTQNTLLGKRKLDSEIFSERKNALLSHELISSCNYDPNKTLAMMLSRKTTKQHLQLMTSVLLPHQASRVTTSTNGTVGIVEVIDPSSCNDVALLWQFSERRGQWQLDHNEQGLHQTYSCFFSPYEVIWNRIFSNKERVYISTWRNRTGLYCDATTSDAPHIGIVANVQAAESTPHLRGRSLTILPSLSTSKLPIVFLLAFQSYQSSIMLRNNGTYVSAIKVDEFELVFEKWQKLYPLEIKLINLVREELSSIINHTGNKLGEEQLTSFGSLLSKLCNIDCCCTSQESSVISHNKCLNPQNNRYQAFYPSLKCSLISATGLSQADHHLTKTSIDTVQSMVQPRDTVQSMVQPRDTVQSMVQPRDTVQSMVQPRDTVQSMVQPRDTVQSMVQPRDTVQSMVQPRDTIQSMVESLSIQDTAVQSIQYTAMIHSMVQSRDLHTVNHPRPPLLSTPPFYGNLPPPGLPPPGFPSPRFPPGFLPPFNSQLGPIEKEIIKLILNNKGTILYSKLVNDRYILSLVSLYNVNLNIPFLLSTGLFKVYPWTENRDFVITLLSIT